MKIWYKDLIVKLVLLFALVKVVGSLYAIYKAYIIGVENPLIPSYLPKYIAFPNFFIIPLWIIVFIGCWKLLKNEILLKKRFVLLIFIVIILQFSEGILYNFLMEMNPYG